MKERFMTLRKALKPISIDYLRDGQWIKPHARTQGANFVKDNQE
jgi:hypothetical protein